MLETIWDSILPNILEIVLTIVSLIISYYVIPCIKRDLVPWLKEKHIYSIVKNFVQAVEKMAETGAIDKTTKKAKVLELLQSKGITVDSTIETFIESCVKELDMLASVVVEEIVEDDVEVEVETKEEPKN